MTTDRITGTDPAAALAFARWQRHRAKSLRRRLAAAHRRNLTAVSRYSHRADAVRYVGRLQP